MMAWTLFYNPIPLTDGLLQLLLIVPLCAAVAVVYKAVRVTEPRRLVAQSILLLGYMLGALIVLAAVLWAVMSLWP